MLTERNVCDVTYANNRDFIMFYFSPQPFWPMGTGIARGFLAALDSAWMIRSWAKGDAPLDVLAVRLINPPEFTPEPSAVMLLYCISYVYLSVSERVYIVS